MSKTRFTPWVVLACIGTLAGCTSGEGGTAGNTELNIVIPNGCAQDTTAPDCFDIQVVEYTIACDDGDPTPNGPFLANNAGFDDRVVISGVLEVFDARQDGRPGRAASNEPNTWGNSLGNIYVAQGFMDLPVTQSCTAQLRARTEPNTTNQDGEVICSDTVTFVPEADKVSTVNVLMTCGLSFQAPVAQLDLAGDFVFNVSNFCPDLFVLNCIDYDLDVQDTPIGDVVVTACQVRFRDGDNSCGDSCDPQDCAVAPEGLRCAPECQGDPLVIPNDPSDDTCPTEPTTTVTCTNTGPGGGAIINCDGTGQPSPTNSCIFNGNTLGVIGAPAPDAPPAFGGTGVGEGGFFVACLLCDQAYIDATCDDQGNCLDPRCDETTGPTGTPLTPGATITCTAETTDGDVDCNKTKEIELTCPGLTPCQTFADVSECSFCAGCNNAVCDGASAATCCTVPQNEGEDCSFENPPLASCQSGSCQSDACVSDADCENDATECLVAPVDACQGDGTCLAEVPGNFGDACNSGVGSTVGTCGLEGTAEAGTCESSDACQVATEDVDCGVNTNECLLNQCNTSGTGGLNDPAYYCETVDNDGISCDPGTGLPGLCTGGDCVENPAFVSAGATSTAYRAGPRVCNSGSFPYIAAGSSPEGTCADCLENSCSGGDDALAPCDPDVECPGGGTCDDSGTPNDFTDDICDGGSNDGNACDSGAECTNGNCVAATPGPAFCALDCFTFECSTDLQCLFGDNDGDPCTTIADCPGGDCVNPSTDFLFPGGGPGGACVFPTLTEFCPYIGCQVVSNTLKNQLAIDTFLFLDVSSTGLPDRDVTVEYNIEAVNAGLALAGPLANLADVTILTNVTDGIPNVFTTKLAPALQGSSVDAYTGTGSFVLTSPDQLVPTTLEVNPTASPVSWAFDDVNFLIELQIKSSGAPLDITGDACTFSNEAGTCFGGANDLRECDPTIDPDGDGDPFCLELDPPIIVQPGECVRTNGAPAELPATFP